MNTNRTTSNVNNKDQKLPEFIWVQSRRDRNVKQQMKKLTPKEKASLVRYSYYKSLSEVPDKVSMVRLRGGRMSAD